MINLNITMSAEHKTTLRRLNKLEDGLKGPVLRRALDVGAKPIVDAMKNLAPSNTGLLRQTIGKAKLSKSAARRLGFKNIGPGNQVILIGPNRTIGGRNRGRTANILEGGAKPHKIRPKKPGGLLSISKKGFARGVNHPGISATHFMENALTQSETGFEERVFRGMTERLDKLVPST